MSEVKCGDATLKSAVCVACKFEFKKSEMSPINDAWLCRGCIKWIAKKYFGDWAWKVSGSQGSHCRPTVTYEYFENPQIREWAEELVDENLLILPSWVQRVGVYSRMNDDHTIKAEICCQQEYRSVHISLYQGFWDALKETRRREFRHELVHAILNPLAGWTRDKIIPTLAGDGDSRLKLVLAEECRARTEHVTEELTFIFGQLLEGEKP